MLNEEASTSSRAAGPSIVVDDDGLLKLMHIRDVHDLPATDIPPSRWPAAPAARLDEGASAAVGEQVRRHWQEAIRWHAGGGARRQTTLLAAEAGDVAGVREVIPPKWHPSVEALLDLDRYTEWFLALPPAPPGRMRADAARLRAATAAAAGRGLGVIVVLPLFEPHASQDGDSCLVVSWGVHADEGLLVQALHGFAGEAP